MRGGISATRTTSRPDRWAIVGAIAIVVAIAVATVLRFGWEDLAPDDSTYLYVGRTVLDGELPAKPSGDFYDLRSPVFPVFLAATDLVEWNDYLGPHLAVWLVGVAGLAGAVLVAGRLGGGPAALATAGFLAITPAIWVTIPSLRIDLALTTGVVATIGALFRPTARRWAIAGLFLGITILLKETSALLVLLPLAWLGVVSRAAWLRLTALYLGIAGVTISWWWAIVWVQTQEIFPLQGITNVEEQDLPGTFTFDLYAWALVAVLGFAWVLFTVRSRDDPRARTVMLAGLALMIPAVYAWEQNLALRQFVPLAVVSCIAGGVAAMKLVDLGSSRRAWHVAVSGTIILVVVVAGSFSQVQLEPPFRRANVVTPLAQWLKPQLAPDESVVINRVAERQLAYELYDEGSIARLYFPSSRRPPALDEFVWLSEFRNQFLGARRSAIAETLTQPNSRFLAFVGPHRTAARELVAGLSSTPGLPGVTPVEQIVDARQYATVFAVDPERVAQEIDSFPLQISAATAMLWLDRQADLTSEVDARQRFLRADPTVHGPPADRAALATRLGVISAG